MDYTVKVKDAFDLAPLFASVDEFVLPDFTRDLESRFWTLGRKVQRQQLLPSPILLYAPTTVKKVIRNIMIRATDMSWRKFSRL